MINVLVTGSRDWPFPGIIENALWTVRLLHPTEEMNVIHGACPTGADAQADEYAHKLRWHVEAYAADWKVGRVAGHFRNVKMRDVLLAKFTRGEPCICMGFCLDWSRGTMDMLSLVKEVELPHMVFSATTHSPGRIQWEDDHGSRKGLFGNYAEHFAGTAE